MNSQAFNEEERERLTLAWDEELRQVSGHLRSKSGAAAVIVLLVDPAFIRSPDGVSPDGVRVASGITGSRRASADMMSAALRELAEQIDDDAEKIAQGVAFVSDTDEARGKPLS